MDASSRLSLRARTYDLLEVGDTLPGRLLNWLIMTIIAVNVAAVILESVAEIQAEHAVRFRQLEVASIAVFTVEYLVRLWVAVENPAYAAGWRGRLRYALTPMALVDLVAVLPFYLGFLVDLDTRILRALRLLRVFKLARHSTAMDLLLTVIRNEAATVASSMFVMLIIIVLAASGIYLIERDVQPEAFRNIPEAMWWAAVTLTTVGYGDVVPVTVAGKIFGLLITIAGVGMVALPAGILASGFSQELQKRRAQYQLELKASLASGRITRGQLRRLRASASELGLSDEEARVLLKTETRRARAVCPHCGKPLS